MILKTSVYLDPQVLSAIDRMAQSQGRSRADVIREAVRIHVRTGENPRLPGSRKIKSGGTVTSNR
jgi:metal-responsive CopG/Arc/MetJ family transcriptional regulator